MDVLPPHAHVHDDEQYGVVNQQQIYQQQQQHAFPLSHLLLPSLFSSLPTPPPALLLTTFFHAIPSSPSLPVFQIIKQHIVTNGKGTHHRGLLAVYILDYLFLHSHLYHVYLTPTFLHDYIKCLPRAIRKPNEGKSFRSRFIESDTTSPLALERWNVMLNLMRSWETLEGVGDVVRAETLALEQRGVKFNALEGNLIFNNPCTNIQAAYIPPSPYNPAAFGAAPAARRPAVPLSIPSLMSATQLLSSLLSTSPPPSIHDEVMLQVVHTIQQQSSALRAQIRREQEEEKLAEYLHVNEIVGDVMARFEELKLHQTIAHQQASSSAHYSPSVVEHKQSDEWVEHKQHDYRDEVKVESAPHIHSLANAPPSASSSTLSHAHSNNTGTSQQQPIINMDIFNINNNKYTNIQPPIESNDDQSTSDNEQSDDNTSTDSFQAASSTVLNDSPSPLASCPAPSAPVQPAASPSPASLVASSSVPTSSKHKSLPVLNLQPPPAATRSRKDKQKQGEAASNSTSAAPPNTSASSASSAIKSDVDFFNQPLTLDINSSTAPVVTPINQHSQAQDSYEEDEEPGNESTPFAK